MTVSAVSQQQDGPVVGFCVVLWLWAYECCQQLLTTEGTLQEVLDENELHDLVI